MNEAEQLAVQSLVSERDDLKRYCAELRSVLANIGYPPGHYYSPLVDIKDPYAIRAVRDRLSAPPPAGVHVDSSAMKAMLRKLASHHHLFRFPRDCDNQGRFYYANPFFGCHDASVYFSMLLEFRPRRVIEIGSGFSSRLLLDVNERFFNNEIEITLIDPSLDSLSDLAPPASTNLLSHPVQETPLALFEELGANDILFVDSSHVSKTGSDVNFYMLQVLPRLSPGVLVHIHDVFWPFEYLPEWVLEEKRNWNETYLLHAFLQYNDAYEIVYWNNFAFHSLGEELRSSMPLCLENEGGSLWIRRVHAR